MAIRFYNSLTRRLEEFQPGTPGQVRMYNCGPTVYSSPHIGNFRSFLLADLLRRFLEWKGLAVTQVMNLTDVGHLRDDELEEGEDKMELASRRERRTVWEIAEHYIDEFFEATRYLDFRPAHHYPRATQHIADMQELIQGLLDRGFAYVVGDGDVYYDVGRFPAYGDLSGNRGEDLLAGARVEVNPDKHDPRDFALWKVEPHHQMQWDAPWGRGFPGWHIECSAMARKYLGDTLDIHTGGEDNVFPHHESEIAQSEGFTGQPFVRYWLHARHLLVDGKKMSKSLGNFHTIADLRAKGYSGDGLRLSLIRSHYRERLNFTLAGLEDAERKIERYRETRRRLQEAAGDSEPGGREDEVGRQARQQFEEALDDDLNVSVALAALDALVTEANRRLDTAAAAAEAATLHAVLQDLWSVLGILKATQQTRQEALEPELQLLIDERQEARGRKDWARADEIRDLLLERNIELVDTKDGARWKRVRRG